MKICNMCGIRKDRSVVKYLGCSIEDFKKYLEDRFEEGMNFDNYGVGEQYWNIDHIIPRSHFDHANKEDILKCWHYTNLQPMWSSKNFSKGNKPL